MNKFQEWCKKAYPFVVAGMNGEKVEVERHGGSWEEKVVGELTWNLSYYRVAPKTIKVNGHHVPAPEREAPKYGVAYYSPALASPDFTLASRWTNDGVDLVRLKRGLVHLDVNAASTHAKAMLDVGGSK